MTPHEAARRILEETSRQTGLTIDEILSRRTAECLYARRRIFRRLKEEHQMSARKIGRVVGYGPDVVLRNLYGGRHKGAPGRRSAEVMVGPEDPARYRMASGEPFRAPDLREAGADWEHVRKMIRRWSARRWIAWDGKAWSLTDAGRNAINDARTALRDSLLAGGRRKIRRYAEGENHDR